MESTPPRKSKSYILWQWKKRSHVPLNQFSEKSQKLPLNQSSIRNSKSYIPCHCSEKDFHIPLRLNQQYSNKRQTLKKKSTFSKCTKWQIYQSKAKTSTLLFNLLVSYLQICTCINYNNNNNKQPQTHRAPPHYKINTPYSYHIIRYIHLKKTARQIIRMDRFFALTFRNRIMGTFITNLSRSYHISLTKIECTTIEPMNVYLRCDQFNYG